MATRHQPLIHLGLRALGIAWLLAAPISAEAGMVNVGVAGGPGLQNFTTPSATPLASGNQVQIGFFDSGFNFSSMSDDLGALQDAWNPFGALGVTSIAGGDGRIGGVLSENDTIGGTLFSGEQIYMFAFETTSNVAPDSNWSNVRAYGIFTNDVSPAWEFPTGDTSSNYTSISTDTADVVHWGSISGSSLQLTSAVPEISPVWACSLILGTAALLKRRRRPTIDKD
ncbi:MAG: hypothetical protein ACR2RV_05915 [Verrucomicrobiales bacterium]